MTERKPPSNRRAGSRKKAQHKRELALCSVPDCGRKAYARGLCQTHHRQKLKTGNLTPIRPYRERTTGTVKFAGLRLTPTCAGRLQKYAAEQDTSMAAAIAVVLEGWAVREHRKQQRQRKKGAPRG